MRKEHEFKGSTILAWIEIVFIVLFCGIVLMTLIETNRLTKESEKTVKESFTVLSVKFPEKDLMEENGSTPPPGRLIFIEDTDNNVYFCEYKDVPESALIKENDEIEIIANEDKIIQIEAINGKPVSDIVSEDLSGSEG